MHACIHARRKSRGVTLRRRREGVRMSKRVSKMDVVKEMLISARQMSTTRFGMLPVFGFFMGYLWNAHSVLQGDAKQYSIVPVVGLLVAFTCAMVEIILSFNMARFYHAISVIDDCGEFKNTIMAHRSRPVIWIARIVFLVPYVCAACLWGYMISEESWSFGDVCVRLLRWRTLLVPAVIAIAAVVLYFIAGWSGPNMRATKNWLDEN